MSGVYLLGEKKLLRVGDKSDLYENSTEGRIKLSDASQFYRSLAFLYESGHPISNSFKLLAKSLQGEAERLACLKVFTYIRQGRTVAQSLVLAGFSTSFASIVRAGEYAGKLDDALHWYADYEERNEAIKRELKQSFISPLLTMGFALGLAVVLPPLVLKEQLTILTNSSETLPFLTQVLLAFSELTTNPAILLLLPVLWLLVLAGKAFWSLRSGRRKAEAFLYQIPFVGDGLKRAAACRSLGMLSLQLKAGLPITKALDFAASSCGSVTLEDRLKLSTQALIGGFPLDDALHKADWYLDASDGLITAGVAAGETASMLALASKLEEDKLRDILRTFASVLQPLMLLVVGVIVCLTILAVLGPTLTLIQTL